jgi:hypothetical protein
MGLPERHLREMLNGKMPSPTRACITAGQPVLRRSKWLLHRLRLEIGYHSKGTNGVEEGTIRVVSAVAPVLCDELLNWGQ